MVFRRLRRHFNKLAPRVPVIAVGLLACGSGAVAVHPACGQTLILQLPLAQSDAGSREKRAEGAAGALAGRIEPLLRQLDAPRFSQRRQAAAQLHALGARAHEALGRIAATEPGARGIAALDLLRQATRSADSAIRQSAREALDEIARSESPRAGIAAAALRDQSPPAGQGPAGRRARPAPAAPKPQPPAFAPRGQAKLRISIRTVNGVRDIQVSDSGRHFRFRDTKAGLQVQRPDGQGGTKLKTYRDARELKAKDPEAFRMYQKAGGGTLPVRGQGLLGLPPGILGPPQMPRRAPANPPADPPRRPEQPGPRLELHPEIAPRAVPKPAPKRDRQRVGV